jgi:hypothetical protein
VTRARFTVFVVFAVLEIVSLGVLLINLATRHDPTIARVIGPVHGAIYLSVALIALLSPGLRWSTRLLGLVPIVGGVLAAVRAREHRES